MPINTFSKNQGIPRTTATAFKAEALIIIILDRGLKYNLKAPASGALIHSNIRIAMGHPINSGQRSISVRARLMRTSLVLCVRIFT